MRYCDKWPSTALYTNENELGTSLGMFNITMNTVSNRRMTASNHYATRFLIVQKGDDWPSWLPTWLWYLLGENGGPAPTPSPLSGEIYENPWTRTSHHKNPQTWKNFQGGKNISDNLGNQTCDKQKRVKLRRTQLSFGICCANHSM